MARAAIRAWFYQCRENGLTRFEEAINNAEAERNDHRNDEAAQHARDLEGAYEQVASLRALSAPVGE